MAYENIQTETKGRVGIIRLNRPKALNALCADLVRELGLALDACEADPGVGVPRDRRALDILTCRRPRSRPSRLAVVFSHVGFDPACSGSVMAKQLRISPRANGLR